MLNLRKIIRSVKSEGRKTEKQRAKNVRKTNCTRNCTLLTQHFISWILNRLVLTPNSTHTPFTVLRISFSCVRKFYTFLLFQTRCSQNICIVYDLAQYETPTIFHFNSVRFLCALRCKSYTNLHHSLDESGTLNRKTVFL